MNKENAAKYLPFVTAMAEGKTIQISRGGSGWEDAENLEFTNFPECYRIKPDLPREWDCVLAGSDGYLIEAGYVINNSRKIIRVREILP